MAALSFHETKNIISGEGGALLINDRPLRRPGRDHLGEGDQPEPVLPGPGGQVHLGRSRFVLPAGEIIAAFLWAQMEEADAITARRLEIWDRYHAVVRRSGTDGRCPPTDRSRAIAPTSPTCISCSCRIWSAGRCSSTGSRPRASSRSSTTFRSTRRPSGDRSGARIGDLSNTDAASGRLVRLPMWLGLEEHLPTVIAEVIAAAR